MLVCDTICLCQYKDTLSISSTLFFYWFAQKYKFSTSLMKVEGVLRMIINWYKINLNHCISSFVKVDDF